MKHCDGMCSPLSFLVCLLVYQWVSLSLQITQTLHIMLPFPCSKPWVRAQVDTPAFLHVMVMLLAKCLRPSAALSNALRPPVSLSAFALLTADLITYLQGSLQILDLLC